MLKAQQQTSLVLREDRKRPRWLPLELFNNLKSKEESLNKWKCGQVVKEEHRRIAPAGRGKIREAKAQNELQKGSRKRFFKYLGSKRKMKESAGPLLPEEGKLIDGIKKAGGINAYFASVFTKTVNGDSYSAQ